MNATASEHDLRRTEVTARLLDEVRPLGWPDSLMALSSALAVIICDPRLPESVDADCVTLFAEQLREKLKLLRKLMRAAQAPEAAA